MELVRTGAASEAFHQGMEVASSTTGTAEPA